MSKKFESEESAKTEEKTFYIFILISKNKETEITFEFDSKKTENFYFLKEKSNGIFRNIFIIKHTHTLKNISEIVNLSFKNKEEIFKLTFNANEGTFIFNPTLKIQKTNFPMKGLFHKAMFLKIKIKSIFVQNVLKKKKKMIK